LLPPCRAFLATSRPTLPSARQQWRQVLARVAPLAAGDGLGGTLGHDAPTLLSTFRAQVQLGAWDGRSALRLANPVDLRRYLEEGEAHSGLLPGDVPLAMRAALRESGLAILLTSLALAGGFLVMGISEFLAFLHFGLLMGATIPMVYLLMRRRKRVRQLQDQFLELNLAKANLERRTLLLEALNEPTKADVEAAMQGHIIAQAELIGTFRK